MKKGIALLVFVMMASGASLFAFGIGLQFDGIITKDFDPGLAVTFKFESVPLIFAANWMFTSPRSEIGLTGDVWFVNPEITSFSAGSLNFFVGAGFFTKVMFGNDEDFGFNAGLRIPVGVNLYLAGRFVEIFAQVAPSFGLKILPTLDFDTPFFPVSAGARLWF